MSGLDMQRLKIRFIAAIILGPAFLYVMYLGGLAFQVVIAMTTARAYYELVKITRMMPSHKLSLALTGTLYLALGFVTFYLIREWHGVWIAILLPVLVMASDIGAYFAGKLIGGPKMAAAISPNKTWAGLAGAVLSPALLAPLYDYSLIGNADRPMLEIITLLLIGGFIGIAGQAGDLLISQVKRWANVKDVSDLIPGHGGLLDRIDSLLMASPLFLLLLWAFPNVF